MAYYFKVFNVDKKAYWQQNQCGYTQAASAGSWTLEQLALMGLDDEQVIIPANLSSDRLRALTDGEFWEGENV